MEGSQETSGCNIFIHQIPPFELNGTDKVCNVELFAFVYTLNYLFQIVEILNWWEAGKAKVF